MTTQMLQNVKRRLAVQPLCAERASDALAYLAARPVHTAYLRSLIRDHGVSSPKNRGAFYACLGEGGDIAGVALFGHAALIEAEDASVIDAFARFALERPCPQLFRGERRSIRRFWRLFQSGRSLRHRVNSELLLVQRKAAGGMAPEPGLRAATEEDVPLLMEVNAGMVCEEGGANPLERDPEGFRRRLSERVARRRVWLLRRGGRLVFKTDVLADTPEAVYIEGVYVAPEERGRGVGARCLARLGGILLERAGAVCLTVNESNRAALSLYSKLGYELHSDYATVYLDPAAGAAAA